MTPEEASEKSPLSLLPDSQKPASSPALVGSSKSTAIANFPTPKSPLASESGRRLSVTSMPAPSSSPPAPTAAPAASSALLSPSSRTSVGAGGADSTSISSNNPATSPDSPMYVTLSFASDKRNIDFHLLFRSVPEQDPLMEDFSCAYQKDILTHGRLFISRDHLCFNSKIFGWVTNLVIAFRDILSIEKKSTAFLIPNALLITTMHSKYFFASFMYRDLAYSVLVRLWRAAMGEPLILEGPSLENADNSMRPRKLSTSSSGAGSDTEVVYAESTISLPLLNSDQVEFPSPPKQFKKPVRPSTPTKIDSPSVDDQRDSKLRLGESLSDSGMMVGNLVDRTKKKWRATFLNDLKQEGFESGDQNDFENDSDGDLNSRQRRSSKSPSNKLFPSLNKKKGSSRKVSSNSVATSDIGKTGKLPRPPVFCNCRDHCKSIVIDRIFPVPISILASVLFGSSAFMEKVYARRGFTDIKFHNWKKSGGVENRKIVYQVPLHLFLAPMIFTQCLVTQRYARKEANQMFCIRESVSLPNIPSGSSFKSLSSQCIMRVSDSSTRLIVSFEIDFFRHSWLQAPLEKTALEGNIAFWQAFESSLIAECTSLAVPQKSEASIPNSPLSPLSPDETPEGDLRTPTHVITEKIKRWTFLDLFLNMFRYSYISIWMSLRSNLFTVMLPLISVLLLIFNVSSLMHTWSLETQLQNFDLSPLADHFSMVPPERKYDLSMVPEWWKIPPPPDRREETILISMDEADEYLTVPEKEFDDLLKQFAENEAALNELMRSVFRQRVHEEFEL